MWHFIMSVDGPFFAVLRQDCWWRKVIDPERETWHLIPMGRSGAGPGSPRLQVGPDALREQVIKAACFTQTAAKSIREPGLIQRGKGTRGDGVAFHKKPPSAET